MTHLRSVAAIGAVLLDDGKGGWLYLGQQHRDNGTWEPPGGGVELDETPDRAVAREILEDTGVTACVDGRCATGRPKGVQL